MTHTLLLTLLMAATGGPAPRDPQLLAAIERGDRTQVRVLLHQGARPDARDAEGNPALMKAAVYGDAAMLRDLLDRGADPNAPNPLGATALLWSAADPAKAKLLLAKGARANVSSKTGRTPLMVAAGAPGASEVVQLLLAHGADVNAHDAIDPIPVLPSGGGRGTALHDAARNGDLASVRLLVDAGADVNAKSANGQTPLSEATIYGRAEIAEYLRAHGASPNVEIGPQKLTLAHLAPLRSVVLEVPNAAPVKHGPGAASARQAVERAVPLLAQTGPSQFKKGGCVSCHHNTLPLVAFTAAAARGVHADPASIEAQLKAMNSMLKPFVPALLEATDAVPDLGITGGYLLESMAARQVPASLTTAAIVHALAQKQHADGRWIGWAQRAPLESGDIQATAYTIRALTTYPLPGREAEFSKRLERARAYLNRAPVQTTEEATSKLLGLLWARADAKSISRAAADLTRLQRPDGGWAQLPTLTSDAYATGKAVAALRAAGVTAPLARGEAFLLRTQHADGSWHVPTRAMPVQPLIDTGFPHGRDQWISAAATAWAIQALAPSIVR